MQRLRSLENHIALALSSKTSPFINTCVLYHLYFHPISPTVAHPFWVTIFHNDGFVLFVTTAGFDPLLLMPSTWLTWQALSCLQVSGAYSDHCCPFPGRCQSRRSAHLSLGTTLSLQLPFPEISAWSKHQMSR